MRIRFSDLDSGDLLFESDHDVPLQHEIREVEGAIQHEFGEGRSRVILLDGMAVIRGSHRVKRDLVVVTEQEPSTIDLHFHLDGGSAGRSDRRLEPHIQPGEHNIWYSPEPTFVFPMDEQRRYEVFEVSLTMEYFESLVHRHPELFDTYFSAILRGEPYRLRTRGLPIEPQMREVIRHILTRPVDGPVRKMLIEAKVLELLALQIDQAERGSEVPQRRDGLSLREIDRMVEARDRLLASADDPPTLAELARAVGTNEFTLKRDFKAVFGNTVFGLLFDHKMERARLLLVETDRRVSDIARELGYTQTGHFSTAFKKKFGMPPSAYRVSV